MDTMVEIGAAVRYPRTGTMGKVVRIEDRNGFSFAELDTTGMLYRIDFLVPATMGEKLSHHVTRDEEIRQIEEERRHPRDLSLDEIPNLDGACNGAG